MADVTSGERKGEPERLADDLGMNKVGVGKRLN
jgi:hypothetical protein